MDMRQFNRAPSHKKPAMPLPGELAALLLAGEETLETLAVRYERSRVTVQKHLNDAGFTNTGEPMEAPSTKPKTPELTLLLGGFDDQEWADRALCAQTDPEAFFPEKGGSTREAKKVCARCPVQTDCLNYAIEHKERFGIWGGLSERERRKLTPKLPAVGSRRAS